MRLSIVIICWNDLKVISNCLRSIVNETTAIDFEIIVADNGSSDGSVATVRDHFPKAQVIENRSNLGFGRGNNAGIRVAKGEYVLILNPDTIIRSRALEKIVAYADSHPEGGAFGCRVLNSDGSLQHTAQPTPTVWRYLLAALSLRWLGRLSEKFVTDSYPGWDGRTEREIGFHAGCCLLVRRELMSQVGGFDPRFFHQFEDADLCRRVWESGNSVLFCPDAEITHIGGQNRGGYPIEVVLETERSKYRYFHKYYGRKGLIRIRYVSLISFGLRYLGYRLLHSVRRKNRLGEKLKKYRLILHWHLNLNPISFIRNGEEPSLRHEPRATTRNVLETLI